MLYYLAILILPSCGKELLAVIQLMMILLHFLCHQEHVGADDCVADEDSIQQQHHRLFFGIILVFITISGSSLLNRHSSGRATVDSQNVQG